jgi:hypothetical protein
MPTIARINATPVKGTALAQLERAELTSLGIPGNRRFHLVDASGNLFSGAEHGPLVQVRAAYDAGEEALSLAFPDGTVAVGPADGLGGSITTDFYGRPVPGHLVPGPFAQAFSDYVGRDLRLVRTDREGDGPDVKRLTLVSLGSVRHLAEKAAYEGDLDSRRFRINLEVERCEPHEEDTWEGRLVRVGDATLRIHGKIPRCVVTTQDPRTGIRDFNTLKQIARYRPLIDGRKGIPFGMYAEVETPGSVSVGDPVLPDPG